MNETTTVPDDGLRDRAITRVKKKRDLAAHVLVYVLVNGFLVAVWAVTGRHFFWPVFPLAGWGIGLVMNVWDVFRAEVTEESIQREISRMKR